MRIQPTTKTLLFRTTLLLITAILWAIFSPSTAFFWSLFMLWWAFRLGINILVGIAFMFLCASALSAAIGIQVPTEAIANYVYYLLVIVAVLQIIESIRGPTFLKTRIAVEKLSGIPAGTVLASAMDRHLVRPSPLRRVKCVVGHEIYPRNYIRRLTIRQS